MKYKIAIAVALFSISANANAFWGMVVGWLAGALGISVMAATFLIVGGLYLYSDYQAKKAERRAADALKKQSLLVNKNASDDYLPVTYGNVRIGGTRAVIETTDGDGDDTGTEFIYMDLAMCEGETGALKKVFFNDNVVWDKDDAFDPGSIDGNGILSDYIPHKGNVCSNLDHDNKTACEADGETWYEDDDTTDEAVRNKYTASGISIQYFTGSTTQVASTVLKTGLGDKGTVSWSNAHKLSGIAYLAIELTADSEIYRGGLPVITAELAGRKITDVSAITDGDTIKTLSDGEDASPVDVLYDYLTNPIYGKGLDYNNGNYDAGYNIDLQSFKDARVVCAGKYAINGWLPTAGKLFDNIQEVLATFGGLLTYTGGVYQLIVPQANEVSQFSFNEDTIIGDITVSAVGKADRLNKISFQYTDPETNFNANTHIVEILDENDINQYKIDDKTTLEVSIDSTLITDTAQLTLMGESMIEHSRIAQSVSFTAPHTALVLSPGEIVDVTYDIMDWEQQEFRVVEMSIQADNTIKFTLQSYFSDLHT
jgi:predicted phage tail protein